MNMDALKNYATRLLEYALKRGHLDEYLVSLGPYEIFVKDQQGNDILNHSIKMEAIYDYYRTNKDSNLDNMVFDALYKYTQIGKSSLVIYSMLGVIEHQIVSERQNKAPFKIDNETLLANLRKNLNDNKALYESEIYEQKGFMNNIRQHDEMLSNNYGHKIL